MNSVTNPVQVLIEEVRSSRGDSRKTRVGLAATLSRSGGLVTNCRDDDCSVPENAPCGSPHACRGCGVEDNSFWIPAFFHRTDRIS
jgi:hypothetical protein